MTGLVNRQFAECLCKGILKGWIGEGGEEGKDMGYGLRGTAVDSGVLDPRGRRLGAGALYSARATPPVN